MLRRNPDALALIAIALFLLAGHVISSIPRIAAVHTAMERTAVHDCIRQSIEAAIQQIRVH